MKVMGILNVTDDSFSDGGKFNHLDAALRHAEQMIADGVDIIDVGGESTRPGSHPVSASEEMERTLPVIEGIKARWEIPVSLDTTKAEVLREALPLRIDLINDVYGLRDHTDYTDLVVQSDLPYVLMHNRSSAQSFGQMEDFLAQAQTDIARAVSYGIRRDRLLYDPGIGFAKDARSNLLILSNMSQLQKLGLPILIGASKKSVIEYATGLGLADRAEATLAITAEAYRAGISIIRVHDVAENVRMLKMLQAMGQWKED